MHLIVTKAVVLITLLQATLTSAAPSNSNRQTFLWPDGVVPYAFGSDFDDVNAQLVIEVLLEIEQNTCLTFRHKEYETAYIEFITDADIRACRTEVVGYSYGRNRIALAPGCFTRRALFHEVLHAIGLDHEHQRSDRDNYVTINYENVAQGHRKEFDVKTAIDQRIIDEVEYDPLSIMHYEADAFASKKGLLTIEANDHALTRQLGKATEPAKSDYRKVAVLYNCAEKPSKPSMTSFPTFETYKAGSNSVPLWPQGVIPYVFNKKVPDEAIRVLRRAMDYIEKNTCLKFDDQGSDFDEDQLGYVEFQLIADNSKQRSGVDSTGAVFGKKAFRIKLDNINNERVINWWLMATIGMLPEARRPDRDHYITINWQNIDRADWPLLAKYSELDNRLLALRYDLESVMHYRSEAFAMKPDTETITPTNTSFPARLLGKSSRPTKLDFDKINAVYECVDDDEESGEEKGGDKDKQPLPGTNPEPGKKPHAPGRIITVPDYGTEQHPDAKAGLSMELVLFLSILAGLVIMMVILIAVIRYKRHRAKQNRNSEYRGASMLQHQEAGDLEVDEDEDEDGAEATSPLAAAGHQQQQRHYARVQYKQVGQQEDVEDDPNNHEQEA